MKILHIGETDSTQNLAKKMIKDGERSISAIIADQQTAGRGRWGREWHSEPGTNLLATYILWDWVSPQPIWLPGVVMAIAASDLLDSVLADCPQKTSLRWPNDIMLDGKKVGGIIIEYEEIEKGITAPLAGVGINVNQTLFPDELTPIAVSIIQHTQQNTPIQYLGEKLLSQYRLLRERYKNEKDVFIKLWMGKDCSPGKQIKAPQGAQGVILEITSDWSAKVKYDDDTFGEVVCADYL